MGTVEFPGDLLKIPKTRAHPRPITSQSQGEGYRHQEFLKLPGDCNVQRSLETTGSGLVSFCLGEGTGERVGIPFFYFFPSLSFFHFLIVARTLAGHGALAPRAADSLECLVTTHILTEGRMTLCTSNKLPDDVSVAGPQSSLWGGQHSCCVLRGQGGCIVPWRWTEQRDCVRVEMSRCDRRALASRESPCLPHALWTLWCPESC